MGCYHPIGLALSHRSRPRSLRSRPRSGHLSCCLRSAEAYSHLSSTAVLRWIFPGDVVERRSGSTCCCLLSTCLVSAICGGLLPPVEYGCAEEDFTPETSRRDGVAPRFGLGPASTGRMLLCGGGFTTAGA
ncbi:hypothetical protein NQZ68_009881 [Dissostichus eleginoides]|nr:hypothetical protein NQZ68_009881 [Dissostichus eleginoides]